MRQLGDFGMPKDRDAVFIHSATLDLRSMPISLLGMFQSPSGVLLPALMILFVMGLSGAAVRVGGSVVQLGGSLVILVMRSVVITSRHV
jgi:hypothetical protein